jgi:predicted nucleic acid-binding protein
VSGPAPPPELLLCDTSFVAASAKRSAHPEQFAHWLSETVDRIDIAILAISVITLAEARYGYLNAGWGTTRIEREERRLAGFLQIPLDLTIIDEWARLKVRSRQNGWNLADNDLWIAATASARGHALVTCDGDQARIDDPSLEVLHLPIVPGSSRP